MQSPRQTYTFQFRARGIMFERVFEVPDAGSLQNLWWILSGFFSDELDSTNPIDVKLIEKLKKSFPDMASLWANEGMDDEYFTIDDFFRETYKTFELEHVKDNTYRIIYGK